jgi:tetratricopeptide (TPR) repeat protein
MGLGFQSVEAREMPKLENDEQRALFLLTGAQRMANVDSVHARIAELYAKLGKWDKAKSNLMRIPKDKRALANTNVAIVMAKAGEIDQAQALLDEVGDQPAVEDFGFMSFDKKQTLHLALMEAKMKHGKFSEAAVHGKFLTTQENKNSAMRTTVKQYAMTGQIDDAVQIAGQIKDKSTHKWAISDIAQVCINRKMYDKAVAIYQQNGQADEVNRAYSQQIRDLYKDGQADKAFEVVKAHKLYGMWIGLLVNEKKLDEAIKLYPLLPTFEQDQYGRLTSAKQIAILAAELGKMDVAEQYLAYVPNNLRDVDWMHASGTIAGFAASRGDGAMTAKYMDKITATGNFNHQNIFIMYLIKNAVAAQQAGQTKMSELLLAQAIKEIDALPRNSGMEKASYRNHRQDLAVAYVQMGDDQRAFAFMQELAAADPKQEEFKGCLAGDKFDEGIGTILVKQNRLDVLMQYFKLFKSQYDLAWAMTSLASQFVPEQK